LPSEKEIKLARKGDKNAFVRIIKEQEVSMYRISKSILKSEDECADAIQETILKAYDSIHKLKEVKYFKTWLIRILINQCSAILKKNENIISIEEWMMPSEKEDEKVLEVQEAVERLSDELKLVVTLYYFEDFGIKTIAEMAGIPEGTVKSRLSRARTELAIELGSENERGVGNVRK